MIIHGSDENLIHKINPIYHTKNNESQKNYNDKYKTNDNHKNNCDKNGDNFDNILKRELKK